MRGGARSLGHAMDYVRTGDPYKVLEVRRGASAEQIKNSYRRLVSQLHPDVNRGPGAEDRLKKVNAAYFALEAPERRRAVDARIFPRRKPMRQGPQYRPLKDRPPAQRPFEGPVVAEPADLIMGPVARYAYETTRGQGLLANLLWTLGGAWVDLKIDQATRR